MGRLGTGVLLKHIVDTLQGHANGTLTHPKFTYYSAHDGTLLSLFSAMGLRENFDILHSSMGPVF